MNSGNHRKIGCPGVLGSGEALRKLQGGVGGVACRAVCRSWVRLHIRGDFAEPPADDGLLALLLHKLPCRETIALLGVLTGF